MARITIVGLGLIGGSLGLALRRAQTEHELVGYDADAATARAAQRRGVVDRAVGDLPSAVEGARLIILATPVLAIRELLARLRPFVGSQTIVTDTASTKAEVLRWAAELLPGVPFVGGHPMAGKEVSGVEAADAALFDGAVYCVVAGATAPPEAVATIADLARAVGAEPYFLSAEEHDSYVAAISHLPFLVSTALMTTAAGATSWRDIAPLAASGFRDTSRLAAGDPVMYHDICVTNRAAILRWLDAYTRELGQLRELIASGSEDLTAAFERARAARQDWERRRAQRGQHGVSIATPGFGARLGHLFLGGRDQREPRA